MLVKVHCLSDGLFTVQGTREKQFSLEASGNAKIHLITIFDGGGERTFSFPRRTFFGTTKLKDFLTLSSFCLSQRRKL